MINTRKKPAYVPYKTFTYWHNARGVWLASPKNGDPQPLIGAKSQKKIRKEIDFFCDETKN